MPFDNRLTVVTSSQYFVQIIRQQPKTKTKTNKINENNVAAKHLSQYSCFVMIVTRVFNGIQLSLSKVKKDFKKKPVKKWLNKCARLLESANKNNKLKS